MPEGLISSTAIRIVDPGYPEREAEICLPQAILDLLGLVAEDPINIQIRDDAPDQIRILRPDTREDVTDSNTVMGFPQSDPVLNSPTRYSFRFPRDWKEEHWRLPRENMDSCEEGLYHMIEANYDLEEAKGFLQADGTLVIPLGE